MKQTYLMLAHVYKKQSISGWYVSEKLDGIRAYWDGGISRGLKASEVPYANTIKDFRLKHEVVATGLWSRTGKVIYSPDWWLNELPAIPLDGELWLGIHSFQRLTSIVAKKDGSSDWSDVQFQVFDTPPYETMLANRKITVRDYDFEIKDALAFMYKRRGTFFIKPKLEWSFEARYRWLDKLISATPVIRLLPHERLPLGHEQSIADLHETLDTLIKNGAEGVMLRKPESKWLTQRSHDLLKCKPWHDDEAVITGFTSGRATEKGSRLLGMIGALIVDYKGKRLELSGLTDAERLFLAGSSKYAANFPGEDMPSTVKSKHFRRGEVITFKYRELSDDFIPKEARYFRQRGD